MNNLLVFSSVLRSQKSILLKFLHNLPDTLVLHLQMLQELLQASNFQYAILVFLVEQVAIFFKLLQIALGQVFYLKSFQVVGCRSKFSDCYILLIDLESYTVPFGLDHVY